MAIIAVIVDHCYGVLYNNILILHASRFSVGLFIILSGYTSLYANEKGRRRNIGHQLKAIGRMYLQYAIATLVIFLYSSHFFDLKNYMYYVLNFSLSAHFYYLVFFFQLVFIAPLLIRLCKFCDSFKRKYLCHFSVGVVLCYISSLSIRYTHILPVYGAGEYLFGGKRLI